MAFSCTDAANMSDAHFHPAVFGSCTEICCDAFACTTRLPHFANSRDYAWSWAARQIWPTEPPLDPGHALLCSLILAYRDIEMNFTS